MTKTNKNTLKNLRKKPLGLLLGLSILAGMSTSCLANEKHEQFAEKMKMKIFTEEDVKGWGWVIASVEASKLGLDEKEFIFKYSKEDLKLIRKLSDFFDTEEKRKQMARIDDKQKGNAALTEEESLIFENYNEALAELRKMLKQKTETSSADVNADEPALYGTKGAEEAMELAEASEKTEELSPEFKRKLKQYYSLDQYTRAVLTAVNSWNGNFDLTTEEEQTIKEADAFYSKEENQKLLRSSRKNSAKLSKEEEEASKESLRHMLALAQIKERPNQKTTDQKQETDHGIN